MRAFAESSDTVRLFKEAALNQNINNGNLLKGKYKYSCALFHFAASSSNNILQPDTYDKVLREHPLILCSRDPRDYRNDVLAKIIPKILNPLGNDIIIVQT